MQGSQACLEGMINGGKISCRWIHLRYVWRTFLGRGEAKIYDYMESDNMQLRFVFYHSCDLLWSQRPVEFEKIWDMYWFQAGYFLITVRKCIIPQKEKFVILKRPWAQMIHSEVRDCVRWLVIFYFIICPSLIFSFNVWWI